MSDGGGARVLELRGVSRSFGAVRALDAVDLTLGAGQVLGLMGDNGAGKTTLLKLVAGLLSPGRGTLALHGEPVRLTGPADARRRGVETVYQDLALCPNLSAAENVFLGRERTRRVGGVLPWLDRAAMRRRAAELFAELGSDTPPGARVATLSGGQRQAVAIARACLARARLVLLDEPTAAISVRQVGEVLDLIRRLRDQGVAVVLVSHRLRDVYQVSDRIAVLRRGAVVADRPVAQLTPEQVTGLITGAVESA